MLYATIFCLLLLITSAARLDDDAIPRLQFYIVATIVSVPVVLTLIYLSETIGLQAKFVSHLLIEFYRISLVLLFLRLGGGVVAASISLGAAEATIHLIVTPLLDPTLTFLSFDQNEILASTWGITVTMLAMLGAIYLRQSADPRPKDLLCVFLALTIFRYFALREISGLGLLSDLLPSARTLILLPALALILLIASQRVVHSSGADDE